MAAVPGGSVNAAERAKLRELLNSNYPDQRKSGVKRAVSLMRSGENVHDVFSDVLRCAKTDDLELKKLVYLYLLTYSSQEPEQAIMVVNVFLQDCAHKNPLVRALAVRTMCRIKLESVAEYMIVPLKTCLKDPEAYVRKTAAFGVSKLYEIVPESIESAGIFPELIALLQDENPMVVSNTCSAIFEISERRSRPLFKLSSKNIGPILSTISSSSEWCQAMLLEAVSRYAPETAEDATFLVDRLIPMLKNSNPAVIMGAFKCIFLLSEADGRNPATLFQQVLPPIMTLATSAESEIQYVVLRTLSLFVQKYPKALAKEIRMFFCKFNDPPYIKLEKLDIIVTICNETTARVVLDELNEYCNGVDVAFVRKAVKCIGQIAIKIEAATRRCVDILVSLVDGKAEYAIEEAIVVVSDILRRFPGSFESVIAPVCQHFEQHVHDPRAKAAAIWILGEYCNIIENVDNLLDPFLDTFHDEDPSVQLQILTAIVKTYIADPEKARDQLQFVLNEATKGLPDVRNRAYIYWKLLSTDKQTYQTVIKFNKEQVDHSGVRYDDAVLSELIRNMGSAAGVLHVVPSDFVSKVSYEGPIDDEFDALSVRTWQKLSINDDKGIFEIWVDWESTTMHVKLLNRTTSDLTDLAIAINKNALGMGFADTPKFPASLPPGEACEIEIPLLFQESRQDFFQSATVAVAIKTNFGTAMTTAPIPVATFTQVDGRMEQEEFRSVFVSAIPGDSITVPGAVLASDETLRERNVFVVGKNQNKTYASLKLPPNATFVVETVSEASGVTVNFKVTDAKFLPFMKVACQGLFFGQES